VFYGSNLQQEEKTEERGKDENCPEEAEQALDLEEVKEFFTSASQTMPTCCMRQHDDTRNDAGGKGGENGGNMMKCGILGIKQG
jgi:hypothetical protein